MSTSYVHNDGEWIPMLMYRRMEMDGLHSGTSDRALSGVLLPGGSFMAAPTRMRTEMFLGSMLWKRTQGPRHRLPCRPPAPLAVPLAYVGRTKEALTVLEWAVDANDEAADGCEGHPMLASLRGEPRFREIARKARARTSER